MDTTNRGRTRRELLRLLGVVGIGSLAAACAPATPPQPTSAPKAAAPTSPPAPAATTAAKPTAASSAPTAAAAKPAAAPAVAADFYKDKSIRLIVGWEPGTSTDTQARYFAQELPKFIPGNPRMAVTNQPGAGAMIAVNGMWTTRPDGLTLAYGPGAGPVDQLQRFEEAKYEYNGFVRAFTFENRTSVWYMLGDAPYKRVQDAIGGDKEFTFGLLSEADNLEITMIKDFLRLPIRLVYGIEGGFAQTLLAFDRRDVQSVINGSWYQFPKQRPGWLKDGYIVPFAVTAARTTNIGNNGEIDLPADTKNVRDFMNPEQERDFNIASVENNEFYRNAYFPPKTPPEVRDIMSNAMESALKDPTFHAGLVKIMGREPDEFVPGRKLDEIANSFSVRDLDAVLRKYKVGYKSPF